MDNYLIIQRLIISVFNLYAHLKFVFHCNLPFIHCAMLFSLWKNSRQKQSYQTFNFYVNFNEMELLPASYNQCTCNHDNVIFTARANCRFEFNHVQYIQHISTLFSPNFELPVYKNEDLNQKKKPVGLISQPLSISLLNFRSLRSLSAKICSS